MPVFLIEREKVNNPNLIDEDCRGLIRGFADHTGSWRNPSPTRTYLSLAKNAQNPDNRTWTRVLGQICLHQTFDSKLESSYKQCSGSAIQLTGV